ncbi:DinB family protein [Caenispirillum salinarum]|uniref:DinB family protein n=1 Tax=Caenispirillum salinarum TaxID=859058 RepID=UPI00384CDA37
MTLSQTVRHVRTMARYNAWANTRLYDAVLALPPGEAVRERPSFFGSVVKTLNHVLVGDRIWFSRIEGTDAGVSRLDEVLYAEPQALYGAREDFDAHIIRTVDGWDDARLAGTFRYANMAGETFEQPLHPVLTHVFNHQTHHRGQVHQMLSENGVAPPSIDLIYFLRDPASVLEPA